MYSFSVSCIKKRSLWGFQKVVFTFIISPLLLALGLEHLLHNLLLLNQESAQDANKIKRAEVNKK